MKKCFFVVLFLLGCFFSMLMCNDAHIRAAIQTSITVDEYDERNITVELSEIHGATEKFMVYEVEMCNKDTDGDSCLEKTIGEKTEYIKLLDKGQEFTVTDEGRTTHKTIIDYTIDSTSDGEKYFYFEAFINGQPQSEWWSTLIKYNLTTLTQRVIINPDGNDRPLHVYDNIQYSPNRTLNVKVNLLADEIENTFNVLFGEYCILS